MEYAEWAPSTGPTTPSQDPTGIRYLPATRHIFRIGNSDTRPDLAQFWKSSGNLNYYSKFWVYLTFEVDPNTGYNQNS